MAETPTSYASGTMTPVVSNRSVADGVTNTTTTITSATAAFVAGDVGRIVTGSADLGVMNYIASVTNGTTALLAVAATGTHSGQTFNLTQEFVLKAINIAGVFELSVDKINLAAADVLELRVYDIVLTAGTPRVCYLARFADAQPTDDMLAKSPVVGTDLTDAFGLVFTLTQTKGTARAFPWKVLQY